MSKKEIPVLRIYFMLRAKRGSAVESSLRAAKLDLDDVASTISHRSFEGKGSSYHPPFGALEIGFELFTYDLPEAERRVARLFEGLDRNAEIIRKLTKKGALASFVMNVNSMNAEQRPVCFLSREQVELLAQFGATVSVDGYLMF